jgi:hypothetical protein
MCPVFSLKAGNGERKKKKRMKVKILYGITAYGIADAVGSVIDIEDKKAKELISKGLVSEQTNQATTPAAIPTPKKATKKK